MMVCCPYTFRILGPTTEPRRLVDAVTAFNAYAGCDPLAEVDREAYLCAFCFGEDFRDRVDAWGLVDVKKFPGPCWAPFVWFDIDRQDDLERALCDARHLAVALIDRLKMSPEDLLVFFSGRKGFHLGVRTSHWQPEPSVTFNRVARRFAELIAEVAGVAIDSAVYDKVRAFRAPNSRHPKTSLHKRRLSLDELNRLSLDDILQAAREPVPFSVPSLSARSEQAAADWATAALQVEHQEEADAQRRAASNGAPRLNRLTLDFITNGAEVGDRHRRLYSAAANLAEFDCPPALAHALLTEAGRNSGLGPSDVQRQIECGLAARGGGGAHHA